MRTVETTALVVGAGPAGLAAADALSASGLDVVVAEAKPSPARKLLMAGKSGLNLTKDEPPAEFCAAYGEAADRLAPLLAAFGPAEVRAWAEGLGQPCFVGSSGRVFPRAMKASPLLRAWLARLAGRGVVLRTGWRWLGWDAGNACFSTSEGATAIRASVTVLALGGASWSRLGSDGTWAEVLAADGVPVAPFRPANVGFDVAWSEPMARYAGIPVKPLRLSAGGQSLRGEIAIARTGIEGGGLYPLSPVLRDAAEPILVLDLLPDLPEPEVGKRLARPRGKASLANHLRRTLRLPPVKLALLREAGAVPAEPAALAARLKSLPLRLIGPRPLDEAISTAGGVAWCALDQNLMLRDRPGVFVAGEMIDWEAPTGGYLLTACLATGFHAGQAAASFRPA